MPPRNASRNANCAPENAAVALSTKYLKLIATTLDVTVGPGSPPAIRLDSVTSDRTAALREGLQKLLEDVGPAAIDAVRRRQDAMIQMLPYGLISDFTSAVRTGYLLGDRVVVWDVLGSRLLRSETEAPVIASVASSLLEFSSLAERGAFVVLPHPAVWHEGTRAALSDPALRSASPKLLGLVAAVAVSRDLRLHPYTVADTDEEFDALTNPKFAAAADVSESAYRDTVLALGAQRLISRPQIVELLDLPPERLHEIIGRKTAFYRGLRDRLSSGSLEESVDLLASEIDEALERRGQTVRETADEWASFGATIAGVIAIFGAATGDKLAMLGSGIAAISQIASYLARTGTEPDEEIITAVFRAVTLERASREYVTCGDVEAKQSYLESLRPSVAAAVLDRIDDTEVWATVNVRGTYHAYVCEFLEFIWQVSPAAFWRHARIACDEGEEGIPVADVDGHWDILRREEMPDDVWLALLDTIDRPDLTVPEQFLFRVVREQTNNRGPAPERMRSALRSWLAHRTDRETTLKLLSKVFEGEIPAWL